MALIFERTNSEPIPASERRAALRRWIEVIADGDVPTGGREDPARFGYFPGLSSLQTGYSMEIQSRGELAVARTPDGAGVELIFRPKSAPVTALQAGSRLGWSWESGAGFARIWPLGAEGEIVDHLDDLMRAVKCDLGVVDLFALKSERAVLFRELRNLARGSRPTGPPVDLCFGSPTSADDANDWIASAPLAASPWLPVEPCTGPFLTEVSATDIPGYLAHVAKAARSDDPTLPWAANATTHAADLVIAAVPYLLPAEQAELILASDPPTAELLLDIRLPFPAVACVFDTPLQLRTRHRLALPSDPEGSLLATMRSAGGAIAGMVFFAETDQRPREATVWIVATPDGQHRLVPGRVAPCMRRLWLNTAAYLSWGDWQEPGPADSLPPVPSLANVDSGTPRRGAAGPSDGATSTRQRPAVRVIRTARRPAKGGSGVAGGRQVETHLRRGHWRHQRVGPRGGLQHRICWIAPTVVAQKGRSVGRPAVYLLPE